MVDTKVPTIILYFCIREEKRGGIRTIARRYTLRSEEEKLAIVKEVLSGKPCRAWEPEIHHSQVQTWVKQYQRMGVKGLKPRKKPGNPLSRYERKKELTFEEQLLYKIELLKRELARKEAEVARLKRANARKEGDALRR